MDNVGFLAAAYVVTFVAIAGYTWSLHRRLRRVRRDLESRTEASRGGS